MRDVSKLDRKRPYGTVTGHATICFIQENRYYRFDGTLIEDESTPKSEPVPEPPKLTEADLQAERNRMRSEKMREYWDNKKKQAAQSDMEIE